MSLRKQKFREYVLNSNRIARLQAKYDRIRTILGDKSSQPVEGTLTLTRRPHVARRRRIGNKSRQGQPKLFGGSLEEYLEETNQDIPIVIRSCVRVINLFGLHHHGIFRVSGSQVEINNFRDAFERGEDPLADTSDASDINSVAGVMKLYLRELREPVFPIQYFDHFMDLASESYFELKFGPCASRSSIYLVACPEERSEDKTASKHQFCLSNCQNAFQYSTRASPIASPVFITKYIFAQSFHFFQDWSRNMSLSSKCGMS